MASLVADYYLCSSSAWHCGISHIVLCYFVCFVISRFEKCKTTNTTFLHNFAWCVFFNDRKAREDEALASKRLNEMVANYGDVIPRRDYAQLQQHYEVIYCNKMLLNIDYNISHHAHCSLGVHFE